MITDPSHDIDVAPGRWYRWFVGRIELSRGKPGHSMRAMEGMRGFAVFLVFLVHYATLVQPFIDESGWQADVFGALHTIGNRGVDLFFVLSGYLIYGSLIARPQPYGRFMARRIERIYPTFLIVLALHVALSFAAPSSRHWTSDWLASVRYVAANVLLLPGLFPIEPIVTVAWSLSYEMFYYLVLPIVIAVLSLRTRSLRWRVAFFGMVATAMIANGLVQAGPIRLVMFISGVFVYEAIRHRPQDAIGAPTALFAVAVAFGATLIPTSGSAGYTLKTLVLGCGFFALCKSVFEAPSGRLAQWLGFTPLRWLGNMSYSYYLLHGLALNAIFFSVTRLVPARNSAILAWGLLPVAFLLTLIPSTALFLLIERPLSLSPRRLSRSANPTETRTTTVGGDALRRAQP